MTGLSVNNETEGRKIALMSYMEVLACMLSDSDENHKISGRGRIWTL